MIAARGMGLDTCPQAAFPKFHTIIRRELGIANQEIVVCGMSLGYADEAAPENQLSTERMPVNEFVKFINE